MKTYTKAEIKMLEIAAVQLRECYEMLDAAGVPQTVDFEGRKDNSTHRRVEWLLKQQATVKPKRFFPRFGFVCNWEKDSLSTVVGCNTSADGNTLNFWLSKLNFYLTYKA